MAASTNGGSWFHPGLALLHPQIRAACGRQIIDPRGSDFAEIYVSITSRLQALLGTRQDVLLVAGNGTSTMELAVLNLVAPGDPVLVVSQGEFADRFAAILETYRAQVHVLRRPPDQVIQPGDVKGALSRTGPVRACFLVHVETSVGIRSDLEALASTIRRCCPGALIVADGMTSLAAHEICLDAWDLDVLVSASHKALGGPVGLGIISLSDRAWHRCQQVKNPSFSSDLREMRAFHRKGQSRHALPLPTLHGLKAALDLIGEVGIEAFRGHMESLAQITRVRMSELGLALVPPPSALARSVSCFWLPEGLSARTLVQRLDQDHGVSMATGRGRWEDRILRTGHMGLASSPNELKFALQAVEACLEKDSVRRVG